MFLGVDNGLDGGCVALSRLPGLAPVAMIPMPTFKRDGSREIDTVKLARWIRALDHGGDGIVIGVEEPLPHAKSSAAARSMAFSFGKIIGALEASFSYTVVRVPCGNAKDGWQRAMLGKVPQGRTKEYAIAAAQSIWPDETWLASPRCSTPHSGMVDAALIAEFLRMKF